MCNWITNECKNYQNLTNLLQEVQRISPLYFISSIVFDVQMLMEQHQDTPFFTFLSTSLFYIGKMTNLCCIRQRFSNFLGSPNILKGSPNIEIMNFFIIWPKMKPFKKAFLRRSKDIFRVARFLPTIVEVDSKKREPLA